MKRRVRRNKRQCAHRILDKRVNKKQYTHEITHHPFRSWYRYGITGRGRGEDCLKSIEKERQVPDIHLDCMFIGNKKGGQNFVFFLEVARERGTRAVLSAVGPWKSTRKWICRGLMVWLRGIGLEFVDSTVIIGQRTGDKLDRVMEHTESEEEWIEDNQREKSSEQFDEQQDRRESHPVGAGTGKVEGED